MKKNNIIRKFFFTALVMCFSMALWAFEEMTHQINFRVTDELGNTIQYAEIVAISSDEATVEVLISHVYTGYGGYASITLKTKQAGVATVMVTINKNGFYTIVPITITIDERGWCRIDPSYAIEVTLPQGVVDYKYPIYNNFYSRYFLNQLFTKE